MLPGSPQGATKNFRAEIQKFFRCYFGRNYNFIRTFWLCLTFRASIFVWLNSTQVKTRKKLFFSFLSSMIFFYSQYFDLIFLDFGDFVISRIWQSASVPQWKKLGNQEKKVFCDFFFQGKDHINNENERFKHS